jgi:hypothetical protein
VFEPLFACDDDYQRVLRRRYYPALLLPAESRADIRSSVVDSANLKFPTHRSTC